MRMAVIRTRSRLMIAALIPVCLYGCVGNADPAPGASPLHFAVVGCSAPPSPTATAQTNPVTLEQLMARVVDAQSSWFKWVREADSADAKVAMAEEKSAATGKSLYKFTVTGTSDRTVKLVFDTIGSAEPQMLILFQGMYIAKNAAHISGNASVAELSRSDKNGDTLKAKLTEDDKDHDNIGFNVKTTEDGYAYLINYRADGTFEWFWPKEGQKNFVAAGTTLDLPAYEVTKPLGKESVKLLFVSVPITQSLKLMNILPRTRDAGENDAAQLLEASRKSRSGTIKLGTDALSYTVVEDK